MRLHLCHFRGESIFGKCGYISGGKSYFWTVRLQGAVKDGAGAGAGAGAVMSMTALRGLLF